jgi:hypothetical protein
MFAFVAVSSVLTALAVSSVIAAMLEPEVDNPLMPQSLIETPSDPFSLNALYATFYNNSPYLAPTAWGATLAMLAWKGNIRTLWLRRGYDYDAFKLLSKMRGGATKVAILERLSTPKTRLELGKELDYDWKTIDGHVKTLIDYNFVTEFVHVGTYKYLIITEKGKQVLELIHNTDPSKERSEFQE